MAVIHDNIVDTLVYLASKPEDVTPEFAVHIWLIAFMTGVGILKAVGKLPHLNSQLVGILELLGGAVFLPAWPKVLEVSGLNVMYSYVLGCCLIMTALGMVIADPKKRVSPVCWIHAGLTLLFVHQQKIPSILIFKNQVPSLGVIGGFLLYGFILGFSRNVQKRVRDTEEKKKES